MSKKIETSAITAGRPPVTPDAPLNPSIDLTSTFHSGGPIGYGRYGNQTWTSR
jgi:cystathionine gamma-synthase